MTRATAVIGGDDTIDADDETVVWEDHESIAQRQRERHTNDAFRHTRMKFLVKTCCTLLNELDRPSDRDTAPEENVDVDLLEVKKLFGSSLVENVRRKTV